MRALIIAFLAFVAADARADKARDCYLDAVKQPGAASTAQVKPIGCFEKIKPTEDHAYGYRACFVLADGVCTGVLYHYDANIEPDLALFETLTCGKDGVAFKVAREWRTSFKDVGPVKLDVAFSGKIARGALRGTLAEGKTKSQIAWKLTKQKPDVLEQVRLLTRVAECTATK